MASKFPESDDVFTEPSDPSTTALDQAGEGGTRNHVEHHRDLGDAIEAIQAHVSLKDHDHSGEGPRATPKLKQENTHEDADTDSSPSAIHHTLGTGANQAAPGNHVHDYNGSSITGQPYFLCQSNDRPSSPEPGTMIYETDTNRVRVWAKIAPDTSESWRLLPIGSVPRVHVVQGVRHNLSNSGTTIEWRNKVDDTFGMFNASVSRTEFECKEPGLYRVEYSIAWDIVLFSDAVGSGIRVNGAPQGPNDRWEYIRGLGVGFAQNCDGWGEVRLKVGDKVSIRAFHNSPITQRTRVGDERESRIIITYIGP